MASYRYPGVQPFATDQSHIFFGRTEDVEALYLQLQEERVSVLYGKSGLGKSSLLNAGLIPLCRRQEVFEPLVIRFGAATQDSESPLEQCRKFLKQGYEEETFLSRLIEGEDSLWFYAKNRQIQGGKIPLLLFDQFEELFTYPEEQITDLVRELSFLLYTEIPLRFRRVLASDAGTVISEEEDLLLDQPMDPRMLFVIRSDRMHLLNRLVRYLPAILSRAYELKALGAEDARAAIVGPAKLPSSGAGYTFRTPTFKWSQGALQQLLAFLKDPEDEDRVEGILLQLLCQYFEENLVEKRQVRRIKADDLGKLDTIISNYYFDRIESLDDPAVQVAARRMIEEGLVQEGANIRLSLHEAQIQASFGIDQAVLDQLVDSRLLRSEPFLRGGYAYELAHDRLVESVLEAREQRQAEEEKTKQEAALKLERSKRLRARRIATGAILISAIAVGALIFAIINLKKAQAALCSELKEKRVRLELERDQFERDAAIFEQASEFRNAAARRDSADLRTIQLVEVENGLKQCSE